MHHYIRVAETPKVVQVQLEVPYGRWDAALPSLLGVDASVVKSTLIELVLAPPVSTKTDGHWSDGLLKCTDVVEHEHPFTSPSVSGTGASSGVEMTMATGLQGPG